MYLVFAILDYRVEDNWLWTQSQQHSLNVACQVIFWLCRVKSDFRIQIQSQIKIHIYFLVVRYTYLDVAGKTRRLSVLPMLFLILVVEIYINYCLLSAVSIIWVYIFTNIFLFTIPTVSINVDLTPF